MNLFAKSHSKLSFTSKAALALGLTGAFISTNHTKAHAATVTSDPAVVHIVKQSATVKVAANDYANNNGQILSYGTSWKVINAKTDTNGNRWYDLGKNQWVRSDDTDHKVGNFGTYTQKTIQTQPVSEVNSVKTQNIKPDATSTDAVANNSVNTNATNDYNYVTNNQPQVGRYNQTNANAQVNSTYNQAYSTNKTNNSVNNVSPANTNKVATTNVRYNTEVISKSISNSSEENAKNWIAARESGNNYSARNGQYIGKYQLSASYLNGDYSPANQERVAKQYATSRYGSFVNAQKFWQANGWW